MFLMRVLARHNLALMADETYAKLEANVAAALAVAYRDNPQALVDNLGQVTLMEETRVKILARLQAETRAVAEALAAQLDAMVGEATMEPSTIAAFGVLSETTPNVALDIARRHLSRATPLQVRCRLLQHLVTSRLPEDEALGFRLTLHDRELRINMPTETNPMDRPTATG